MPRIMPNESSRARSSFHQPAERSRAGARQIRSSASCSSPKTVVAPISRRTTPIVVAATPSAGLLTLASRPSIALAASAPISCATWPKISPRAASSPNTRPAIATTISSSGASEKTV